MKKQNLDSQPLVDEEVHVGSPPEYHDGPVPPRKPHLVLSVATFMFCSFGFGFCAVVMSLLAYIDHGSNNWTSYKRRKTWALRLSILGIITGIVIIPLYIFYMMNRMHIALTYLASKQAEMQSTLQPTLQQ